MTFICQTRSAQRDPGTVQTGSVLAGLIEDVNDLVLLHFMPMNVRCSSREVDIKSGSQTSSTLF
jgi:hypothetical protein